MKTSARAISELDEYLTDLANSAAPVAPESLAALADKLSQAFGVSSDEVAVLGVVGHGKHLQFVIPEKLREVGSIPINSTNALASRTAREKRGDVENSFANSRHASVFEGVPLGRRQDEMIQKIMSAPIVHEGTVAGVVQICRKGRNKQDAGADFSAEDMRRLKTLAPKLAPIVLRPPEE
ncbi:MAG TPA: GAF domain-containing protein [Candidatus Acidoferrum sp.]|nr:GAF domain-containing protein [Candidatus Acidoferrum sp.]